MKTVCLDLTIVLIAISFQLVNGLYEDDYCTNPNGQTGICKLANQCTNLRSLLDEGVRPMLCGFPGTGRFPLICCPPEKVTTTSTTTTSTTTRSITTMEKPRSSALTAESKRGGVSSEELNGVELIAQLKCEEYGKLVIEEIPDPVLTESDHIVKIDHCGRKAEALIVGGTKAEPKEFPHMAQIGYLDPPEYLCGGSLISERFILSAAHCSRPKRKGSARWAKLGELDSSSDFDQAAPEVYRIIQILDHPEYDPITIYNDITLYKLERNVNFNGYVRPICLNYNKDLDAIYAVASGWGHIEFAGKASSHLLKVSLDLVDNDVCNFNYTQTIERGPQIPQGVRDGSMICAGKVAGMDTCMGDSGGPLQLNLTKPYCMYNIIGITSFGRGCAWGYPGVYTRVSNYLPWIVQNVWGDEL